MLDEHRIVSRQSDKVVPNQTIAVVPNQTIVLNPGVNQDSQEPLTLPQPCGVVLSITAGISRACSRDVLRAESCIPLTRLADRGGVGNSVRALRFDLSEAL